MKVRIRKLMRKQRQSEKAQLTQQVQMLTQQNETLQAQMQQMQLYIQKLQAEFTDKINQQNQVIKDKDYAVKRAEDTMFKLMNING